MTDFEKIYKKYFTDVYRYVLAMVRNPSLADEVVAETFFRAMKNLNKFEYRCDVKTWLCTIAKNVFLELLRKDKYLSMDPLPDQESGNDSFELQLIEKEETQRIHQLLHNLKEPYKEVFSLRIFGELPYREIGTLFERTENWARVVFYRAKSMIKKEMEDS